MSDSLTQEQVQEVERIAELETRRYFDHYLNVIFPAQQKAAREHTHLMIEQHDAADGAHGGVERRFSRMVWMLAGVATVGGAGGALLPKLATVLFGVG